MMERGYLPNGVPRLKLEWMNDSNDLEDNHPDRKHSIAP